MLINLSESKLFSVDPAYRFAQIYKVRPVIWNEVWRRYHLSYDLDGLCGYLLYKTDIRLEKDLMRQWLFRAEIYHKARSVMLMGVRVVQSEYFGEHKEEVERELTRALKFGQAKDSRVIV